HAHRVAPTNARLHAGDLAMARSPAEIQADIAVTRRVIERQLDALGHAVEGRWWAPYAVIAGGFAVGFVVARMPIGRVVRIRATSSTTTSRSPTTSCRSWPTGP